MEYKGFEATIRTERLLPPLEGEFHFAARCDRVIYRDPDGSVTELGPLGESWGRTEREARDEMRREFHSFVDSRPESQHRT